jgi:hypothetical protein
VLSLRTGSSRRARLAVMLAVLGLGVTCHGALLAQPAEPDKTEAEKNAALKAFEDGLDLEKKGDHAAALEKFQKVGAFKMTPHVRFHIALCEEKLGHLVAAMRGFELAAAEATKMGKDAQVVADKAPQRVEALRKRIAQVRIEVKGTILYSHVLIDGQPVLEKDFGTLIPVDPGAHSIKVVADGVTTQQKDLTLAEKGYETVTFEIEDKEKPPPAPTVTATATVTETAPPPPPPPPSRLPAFVLGGVGVASLIGAGVFYGLRGGALGSFQEACPVDKYPPNADGVQACPPDAQGPYNDAQSFTIAAGVMLGVGIAALGGAGAYWFFTQRKPAQQKPAIGVSVSPTSLRLIGRF